MSLKELRERVFEANMDLVRKNLVISTWGNVSGYDEESGLMLIKPSGVAYSELRPEMIVPVNMDGEVVDSTYVPSTDTKTHIEIYKAFKDKGIRGVIHTHSTFGTIWAQLGRDIPAYGTTHVDYYLGDIPCTRAMTTEEIEEDYEKNTGKVIMERFEKIDPIEMQAVLVRHHAPFCWGKSPEEAVLHAEVLEQVAKMAIFDFIATGGTLPNIPENIKQKHYNRKFGPDSYYGQGKH